MKKKEKFHKHKLYYEIKVPCMPTKTDYWSVHTLLQDGDSFLSSKWGL